MSPKNQNGTSSSVAAAAAVSPPLKRPNLKGSIDVKFIERIGLSAEQKMVDLRPELSTRVSIEEIEKSILPPHLAPDRNIKWEKRQILEQCAKLVALFSFKAKDFTSDPDQIVKTWQRISLLITNHPWQSNATLPALYKQLDIIYEVLEDHGWHCGKEKANLNFSVTQANQVNSKAVLQRILERRRQGIIGDNPLAAAKAIISLLQSVWPSHSATIPACDHISIDTPEGLYPQEWNSSSEGDSDYENGFSASASLTQKTNNSPRKTNTLTRGDDTGNFEDLLKKIKASQNITGHGAISGNPSIASQVNPYENKKSDKGFTTLMYAAKYSKLKGTINALLFHNSAPEILTILNSGVDTRNNYHGAKIHMIAAKWGTSVILKEVMESVRSDIAKQNLANLSIIKESKYKGWTALMFACSANLEDTENQKDIIAKVETLLQCGAEINKQTKTHPIKNALSIAISKGNMQLFDFLINKKANTSLSNADYQYALNKSGFSAQDKSEVCEKLNIGFNIQTSTILPTTALSTAAASSSSAAMTIRIPSSISGYSADEMTSPGRNKLAREATNKTDLTNLARDITKSENISKILSKITMKLSEGPDVIKQTIQDGLTLFHIAALFNQHKEVMICLLNFINHENKYLIDQTIPTLSHPYHGWNALAIAVACNEEDIVEVLIEAGSKPEYPKSSINRYNKEVAKIKNASLAAQLKAFSAEKRPTLSGLAPRAPQEEITVGTGVWGTLPDNYQYLPSFNNPSKAASLAASSSSAAANYAATAADLSLNVSTETNFSALSASAILSSPRPSGQKRSRTDNNSPEDGKVVRANRVGLFIDADARTKAKNKIALAVLKKHLSKTNYRQTSSYGDGECFFDSAAQSISKMGIILPGGNNQFAYKKLRMICSNRVAMESDLALPNTSWIQKAILADGSNYEQYKKNLQYTINEIGTDNLVWGNPEIEGRMICRHLQILLHLIEIAEIHNEIGDPKFVMLHRLIDEKGSITLDEEKANALYLNPKVMHMVAYNLHFVPILPRPAIKPANKENIMQMDLEEETVPTAAAAASSSATIKNTLRFTLPLPLLPPKPAAAETSDDPTAKKIKSFHDVPAAHSQSNINHILTLEPHQLTMNNFQYLINIATTLHTSLRCPISYDTMIDPVILVATGHIYNRFHITKWLINSNKDPKTSVSIQDKTKIPCLVTRSLLTALDCELTPLAVDEDTENHPSITDKIFTTLFKKTSLKAITNQLAILCPDLEMQHYTTFPITDQSAIKAVLKIHREMISKNINTAAAASDESKMDATSQTHPSLPELIEEFETSIQKWRNSAAYFQNQDFLHYYGSDKKQKLAIALLRFYRQTYEIIAPESQIMTDPVRLRDGRVSDRSKATDACFPNILPPCLATINILDIFGFGNYVPKVSLPKHITPLQLRAIRRTFNIRSHAEFCVQLSKIMGSAVNNNELEKNGVYGENSIKAIYALSKSLNQLAEFERIAETIIESKPITRSANKASGAAASSSATSSSAAAAPSNTASSSATATSFSLGGKRSMYSMPQLSRKSSEARPSSPPKSEYDPDSKMEILKPVHQKAGASARNLFSTSALLSLPQKPSALETNNSSENNMQDECNDHEAKAAIEEETLDKLAAERKRQKFIDKHKQQAKQAHFDQEQAKITLAQAQAQQYKIYRSRQQLYAAANAYNKANIEYVNATMDFEAASSCTPTIRDYRTPDRLLDPRLPCCVNPQCLCQQYQQSLDDNSFTFQPNTPTHQSAAAALSAMGLTFKSSPHLSGVFSDNEGKSYPLLVSNSPTKTGAAAAATPSGFSAPTNLALVPSTQHSFLWPRSHSGIFGSPQNPTSHSPTSNTMPPAAASSSRYPTSVAAGLGRSSSNTSQTVLQVQMHNNASLNQANSGSSLNFSISITPSTDLDLHLQQPSLIGNLPTEDDNKFLNPDYFNNGM